MKKMVFATLATLLISAVSYAQEKAKERPVEPAKYSAEVHTRGNESVVTKSETTDDQNIQTGYQKIGLTDQEQHFIMETNKEIDQKLAAIRENKNLTPADLQQSIDKIEGARTMRLKEKLGEKTYNIYNNYQKESKKAN